MSKVEEDSKYFAKSTITTRGKIKAKKEKRQNSEPDTEETEVKKEKWEPINWKVIMENIEKMRSQSDAPVDSMGCDAVSYFISCFSSFKNY